ncbi:MAG TPA: V-type ATP synthase subunit E family protein [Planctomycetota bacterium]|nr:V-type ATP synthase subunit E family protein [Planctomycetota bacterium]HUV39235.1 V-type ATP synthase subunit E family protein [Planctomycetota bacterium]
MTEDKDTKRETRGEGGGPHPDKPEDVLRDEILGDARRRAERTVKRAERDAGKTVEEAVKRAEAVRDRALDTARRRIARDGQVFASSLALEERMRRLKTQGALLVEVFDGAVERLRRREGFDPGAVVREFAVEAVLAMTGDAFVLRLAKPDLDAMKPTLDVDTVEAVRKASGRQVTVTVAQEPVDIAAGVVVESADGSQQVDGSLTGRLDRLREELRFEVAGHLFPDAADAAKDGTS